MSSKQEAIAKFEAVVHEKLQANESVVWMDTPKAVYFTQRTVMIMMIGIALLGLSIYFFFLFGSDSDEAPLTDPQTSSSLPVIFYLFIGFFLVFGVTLLFAPIFTFYSSNKTLYVITTHRALIFQKLPNQYLHSYGPNQLNNMQMKNNSDGSGDIIFEQKRVHVSSQRSETTPVEIGFKRIEDLQHVARLLTELKNPNKHIPVVPELENKLSNSYW